MACLSSYAARADLQEERNKPSENARESNTKFLSEYLKAKIFECVTASKVQKPDGTALTPQISLVQVGSDG